MLSRRLVRTLAAPPTFYTRKRRGIVTAVSSGPPVTVTAMFSDANQLSPPPSGVAPYPGTPIPNLIPDAAYSPVVGDLIYVLQSGANWQVLGKTSP